MVAFYGGELAHAGADAGLNENVTKAMHAGWVLLYFALGCLVLALAIFPEFRRGALPLARVCVRRARRAWATLGGIASGVLGPTPATAAGGRADSRWGDGHVGWTVRWRWIAGGAALLLMPVLAVLAWGLMGTRQLEGFDDRVEPANAQVAQLLQGEHLVPPPPLPPEVFATVEVEQVRPMLSSADRRWDQMDPAFVQRLLMVFRIMKERHGYDMALLEGYRSPERQAMLAAKGSHVTMAGAWQSYHQYGLAADCAFYRDGKLVISERDPWAMRGYELYGEVAEQLGLTWGGRWRMMDFGHVEWRKPGARRALTAGRTP